MIKVPNMKTLANTNEAMSTLKQAANYLLKTKIPKETLFQPQTILTILEEFDPEEYLKLKSGIELINQIVEYIKKNSSGYSFNYKFLSFYPLYINFITCNYQRQHPSNISESKQQELNKKAQEILKTLQKTKGSKILDLFLNLLQDPNYLLLLQSLAYQLSLLSKEIKQKMKTNQEQRNDSYSTEVLYREIALALKYEGSLEKDIKDRKWSCFLKPFSNLIYDGEAFELVDGDNCVYHDSELSFLLSDMVKRREQKRDPATNGAPIVISVLGPQSSGKSTLLNYTFGCKFVTSASRCTRGVYGSIFKLAGLVNNSDSLLILDTEGLDSVERGSIDNINIQFDRTMVLFCLAVSQAVIINIKGELGQEM